jgi:predicted dehydrogenase
VGIIGCGGRGSALSGILYDLADGCNVTVVAVCDVWKPALQKSADTVTKTFGGGPRTFQRYADLLGLTDVDAVVIATPDFAHARILTEAAEAGKHVYCEKPMASNMQDANAAVKAVESNRIVCQVGTQRRSCPRHQKAAELMRSGIVGIVSEVETCYNRCTPSWVRDYSDVRQEDVDWEQYLLYLPKRDFDPRRYRCWHLYKDYTVGLAGLLGSHVIDVGTWFMDDPLPEYAVGLGGTLVWKEGREHADTMESIFMFPKGFLLRFTSRLGNSSGGYEIQFRGTKGTFDTADLTADGEGGGEDRIQSPVTVEELVGARDWTDARPHVQNWLECIRSGRKPNADVHAGYAHSVASIMAHQAMDTGRRVRFDLKKREIKT